MAQDEYPAVVRRVETPFAETGDPAKGQPGQYADRVDVTYEVGAEIDGAWVRMASVPGTSVDSLVARAKDNAPPADRGPTMAEVTPTPEPQAEAEQAEGSGGGTTTL